MSKNLDLKIKKQVDKNHKEIVNFLQQILRIDSETGKEKNIQNYLEKYLLNLGLEVDKFEPSKALLQGQPGYIPLNIDFSNRPNVIGTLKGNGKGKSLILNGHTDTITAEPLEAWTFGPFSGTIHEDKIYGRGAADMKSGVAAMIMALKIVKDLEIPLKGDVIVECVVDEEYSGYGTLSCIAKGYQADAGICCETSDLNIQPACIGRQWFFIDVYGKTSSIANKWESVSAIEKGIKIVNTINELEKIRINDLFHPLYTDNRSALPCSVFVFKSGSFPSAIPERARLEGSLGTMPFEKVEDVKNQVINQIKEICDADPWMKNHPPRITFAPTGGFGAEIPTDAPIVKDLEQSFKIMTGSIPVISGRTGGSDTRFLINYGNTPTVIFGPGSTSQMHAIDEHVKIEDLLIAVKTIALCIANWCF